MLKKSLLEINEGAMLTALVEFLSQELSEIIAVYWGVDIFQQISMLIIFGAGFLLTLIELIYSAGAIVAAKYGLMAVAFVSLGLACYCDVMDSDGIWANFFNKSGLIAFFEGVNKR